MDPAPAHPDPRAFLRPGVDTHDAVQVTLATGVALWVRPARATAMDVLAGRASAYAVAAMRARDEWVRAARMQAGIDPAQVAVLVIEAVRDAYDAPPEIAEAWLAGADVEGWRAIAAVAIGANPTPAARERGRAAALVAAGLGNAPLAPIDAAGLADWSVNAGRAPAWG